MKPYIAYGISIVVIVLSAIMIYVLPLSNSFRELFSLPAIMGLFSILVQGWRDQISYEREKELQKKQHEFELSVASHMANVVFDKQVEFCEKYYQKMVDIISNLGSVLFRDIGDMGRNYVKELKEIRRLYSPWISSETENKLVVYENKLWDISAGSFFSTLSPNSTEEEKQFEKKTKSIFEVYAEYLGIKYFDGERMHVKDAASIVLDDLKEILGVTDLETLRRNSLNRAVNNNKPQP